MSSGFFFNLDPYGHLTLRGELQGIAHEIHQNLAETGGVPLNGRGDVGIYEPDQLQALFLGFKP